MVDTEEVRPTIFIVYQKDYMGKKDDILCLQYCLQYPD